MGCVKEGKKQGERDLKMAGSAQKQGMNARGCDRVKEGESKTKMHEHAGRSISAPRHFDVATASHFFLFAQHRCPERHSDVAL